MDDGEQGKRCKAVKAPLGAGSRLVATDGVTPPIWFGQGSDPEILGVVTVGVHHLVD